MADSPSQFKRRIAGAFVLSVFLMGFVYLMSPPRSVIGQLNEPDEFVELAPYMNRLQTLTHKLSLSIENSNHRLAEFYLYESLEALEDIKNDVPEYRGHPIALMVDQVSTPMYSVLEVAIKEDASGEGEKRKAPAAFEAVVQSCNQCHAVTKHEFIKIAIPRGVNPFFQDFKPSK